MKSQSCVAIALALWATPAANTFGADQSFAFGIATHRDDDRVEVISATNYANFSIRSPFGISRAVIERVGDEWPEVVDLRLHLSGLEHFEVSDGVVKLEGSTSLHEGKLQFRIWKNGAEKVPLDSGDSCWIKMRLGGVDRYATPELPLKQGYFRLRLPKGLFQINPKIITVSWIDYYRA